MTVHRTLPADAAPHPAGWAELPGTGYEVSRLPLVDRSVGLGFNGGPVFGALDGSDAPRLFARLTYRDAAARAAELGAELPRPEHLEALRACGLVIEPAPIPITTSLDGSARHDAAVHERLRAAGWDERRPVCGAGKHWLAGAPPGRAYLMGWWTEHLERYSPTRRGSGWVQPVPSGQGPHGDTHHDYATTTLLVRRIGAGRTEEVSPMADTIPPASPSRPSLERGSRGPDVARWQAIVGATADGIFGPATEAATRGWEARHGLPVDGAVSFADWTEAARRPAPARIPFVRARNFYVGRAGKPIDLVVLHSMESSEKPSTAENVAAWFAGPSAPRASCHYCVDCDSVVQCVREEDRAWHAGRNANDRGIGIEHAGYARQSEAEWLDEYSAAMLRRSAALVADICRRHAIPVVALGPEELRAGARGITTHAAVSRAWRQTDHTDPGPSFPMARFLEMVRQA